MFFINFAGFFQCRLATDPDPTDEKRGVSGYSFALAGEPDLDRIIRLHNPVALRSHSPEIGVFVTSVAIGNEIQENHPLIGAKFDLLGEPKFWMLNYIMTIEAGLECIYPFEMEISGNGITISRSDNLNDEHPGTPLGLYDATFEQMERRGGQFGLPLNQGTFMEVTGCETPKEYRLKRLAALKEELSGTNDPVARAALETRIGQIEWPEPDNINWENRRTGVLFGAERRKFQVNGVDAKIVDPDGHLPEGLDTDLKWPIQFLNGVWDCDLLVGYMRGTLQIPIKASCADD